MSNLKEQLQARAEELIELLDPEACRSMAEAMQDEAEDYVRAKYPEHVVWREVEGQPADSKLRRMSLTDGGHARALEHLHLMMQLREHAAATVIELSKAAIDAEAARIKEEREHDRRRYNAEREREAIAEDRDAIELEA